MQTRYEKQVKSLQAKIDQVSDNNQELENEVSDKTKELLTGRQKWESSEVHLNSQLDEANSSIASLHAQLESQKSAIQDDSANQELTEKLALIKTTLE